MLCCCQVYNQKKHSSHIAQPSYAVAAADRLSHNRQEQSPHLLGCTKYFGHAELDIMAVCGMAHAQVTVLRLNVPQL